MMLYLLFTIILGNLIISFSPLFKFFFILVPGTFLTIIRNPLIATCTFRSNDKNQPRKDKALRQLEINVIAKEERLMLNNSP